MQDSYKLFVIKDKNAVLLKNSLKIMASKLLNNFEIF